jgi:putative endopeptidase
MVANLRSAFAARIQHANWISPPTREAAEQKLAEMRVVVGYPKQWHDYSGLAVRSDDLYGDVVRATAFEWDRRLGHLDQPVDQAEWDVTAQSLEAYYDPTSNEVVLPSGILQAPFFDRHADDAVNYGAIGALIGHEMTHGFDDEGRHFDATGALRNWWTLEDSSRFEARAALLVAQYDQYEPYPGVHVNGRLTLGENIADLGGLLIAFDAYHRTLHGQPAPVVRGLTGDQRFFLAYARSWREKTRPGVMRALLASDPHAPEQFRVNGVLRNVDAWYQAFGVRPGDRLYLDPAMRVGIW